MQVTIFLLLMWFVTFRLYNRAFLTVIFGSFVRFLLAFFIMLHLDEDYQAL